MKIEVLGCFGGQVGSQITQISYLIGDSLLIDAGSATLLPLERQYKVDNILISHSHLDHIKDIGFLADNVLGHREGPINIVSSAEVIDAIKNHYLNNVIWPDFTSIPSMDDPVLAFKEIELNKPIAVGDYSVTAFKAVHPVPAMGFIVSDSSGAVVFSNDTGPNDLLWKAVEDVENIKGLIVECSFPNNLQGLADVSGHLTPASLAAGLTNINQKNLDIYICHMKPDAINTLQTQIGEIKSRNIKMLSRGDILDL